MKITYYYEIWRKYDDQEYYLFERKNTFKDKAIKHYTEILLTYPYYEFKLIEVKETREETLIDERKFE